MMRSIRSEATSSAPDSITACVSGIYFDIDDDLDDDEAFNRISNFIDAIGDVLCKLLSINNKLQ